MRATITGYDADHNPRGTIEFYLADFRFEDSAEDYIVDQWAWVDMNEDTVVNGLDVDPFVAAVIGGSGALRAVPEPSLVVLLAGAVLALIGRPACRAGHARCARVS